MAICIPNTADWSCAPEGYVDQLEPAVKVRSETLAWTTLQALTANVLALCPTTVRPCRSRCVERTWYTSPVGSLGTRFNPHVNEFGNWVNSCGCRGDSCGCSGPIQQVYLPGIVSVVTSVLIDGAALDPLAYRVDDGHWLVRQDGGLWPECQDMNKPLGGEGTFGVTYYDGAPPDELTAYAAGVLAYEYSKACNGGKCRLPTGVTSITRQGVSMEITSGAFPGGVTGIREVDAIIMQLNPHGLRQRPVILSPDTGRARRTTWRKTIDVT